VHQEQPAAAEQAAACVCRYCHHACPDATAAVAAMHGLTVYLTSVTITVYVMPLPPRRYRATSTSRSRPSGVCRSPSSSIASSIRQSTRQCWHSCTSSCRWAPWSCPWLSWCWDFCHSSAAATLHQSCSSCRRQATRIALAPNAAAAATSCVTNAAVFCVVAVMLDAAHQQQKQ
jgi:hypothetical protein